MSTIQYNTGKIFHDRCLNWKLDVTSAGNTFSALLQLEILAILRGHGDVTKICNLILNTCSGCLKIRQCYFLPLIQAV